MEFKKLGRCVSFGKKNISQNVRVWLQMITFIYNRWLKEIIMNTQVSARVDENIKKEASFVTRELGLELSDAIRMFVTRIAKERTIPLTEPKPISRYRDYELPTSYKPKEIIEFKENPNGSIGPIGEISPEIKDWIIDG
jgi:addiction module RelB/DinJ family antitoxin